MLQNVALDASKRDKKLNAIRAACRQSQDQQSLLVALDLFFIESELDRDVMVPKTTLEQVTVEELQFIACEVFG